MTSSLTTLISPFSSKFPLSTQSSIRNALGSPFQLSSFQEWCFHIYVASTSLATLTSTLLLPLPSSFWDPSHGCSSASSTPSPSLSDSSPNPACSVWSVSSLIAEDNCEYCGKANSLTRNSQTDRTYAMRLNLSKDNVNLNQPKFLNKYSKVYAQAETATSVMVPLKKTSFVVNF